MQGAFAHPARKTIRATASIALILNIIVAAVRGGPDMKKSRLAEIKARLDSMPDDVKAERLAEIRGRHYDRWMERMAEIGRPVSDSADIDFDE